MTALSAIYPRFSRRVVLTAAIVCSIAAFALGQSGQDDDDQPHPEKAAELIQQAIDARGGIAYLAVRDLESRGEFTPFNQGASTLPNDFVDYIVYPDQERTEFGKGGKKVIQVNTPASAWTYDAQTKLIKDQTDDQIKQYKQEARFDLDILLRTGWKDPKAKLVYLGRLEVWKDTFGLAARIDFPDGGSVTLYFDQHTKLPIMSEYKVLTGDGPRTEQVRFYQWLDFGGIKWPKIQDTFRERVQTARVYFDTVKFNTDIPSRLFDKPASPKDIKAK